MAENKRMTDERLAEIRHYAESHVPGSVAPWGYVTKLLAELDATRAERDAALADNAAMLDVIRRCRKVLEPRQYADKSPGNLVDAIDAIRDGKNPGQSCEPCEIVKKGRKHNAG